MIEALLAILHARWVRFPEIPIARPVRGSIDLVLGGPGQDLLIASEFESELRRVEQQLRRSQDKAAGLAEAPAVRLTRRDPRPAAHDLSTPHRQEHHRDAGGGPALRAHALGGFSRSVRGRLSGADRSNHPLAGARHPVGHH
jgi:hypothetical protein